MRQYFTPKIKINVKPYSSSPSEPMGFLSDLPHPLPTHNFRLRVIVHFLFRRWTIATRQKRKGKKQKMLTKFETKSARVKGMLIK